MTFQKRKGRATFSVGKRGPRASYRLGCAMPLALLVILTLAACGQGGDDPVATPAPFVNPVVPAATSRPPSTTEPDVYYANCDAAQAAGAAPLRRGDPGYRASLDRDSDGVACE